MQTVCNRGDLHGTHVGGKGGRSLPPKHPKNHRCEREPRSGRLVAAFGTCLASVPFLHPYNGPVAGCQCCRQQAVQPQARGLQDAVRRQPSPEFQSPRLRTFDIRRLSTDEHQLPSLEPGIRNNRDSQLVTQRPRRAQRPIGGQRRWQGAT